MAKGLFFMWIEGIKGSSRDPRHINEIDVTSFSWDMGQQDLGVGGGGGNNRAQVHDLTFIKRSDRASHLLINANASGSYISKAILSVDRNSGGKSAGPLLSYVMKDILVSSYQHGSADDYGNAVEAVGLNFETMSSFY